MKSRLAIMAFAVLGLFGAAGVFAQTTVQDVTYPLGTTNVSSPGTIATGNNVVVPGGAVVTYRARTRITLGAGFRVNGGGFFQALIDVGTPLIATQPVSASIIQGQTASFTVVATGNPAPTYQWRKGGVSIATGTLDTLDLPNVQAADAGNYDVVVANSAGSLTSNVAVLTIVPAAPTALAATNRTSNAFTASWSAVSGATTYRLDVSTSSAFTSFVSGCENLPVAGTSASVTGLQPTVSYFYRVRVTTALGTSGNSNTITVPLVPTAPTISTHPANRTASIGQTAIFAVVALGEPAPAYQWRKGGAILSGATNATLSIANVQSANAGSYDVVVSNTLGMVASNVATLTVSAAVAITSQPVAQAVSVGQPMTFRVVAAGAPPFSYQWRKGGTNVAGATNASYTIASVQTTDAGSYDVVVTNGAGGATSNAVVFTVLSTGMSVTHGVIGGAYVPGATVSITNTLTFVGSLVPQKWQVLLPPGWSYASDSGATGQTKPATGMFDLLEWTWTSAPASPATFTYVLNVPVNALSDKEIIALALLSDGTGMLQILAKPDPLLVRRAFHNADTNMDFQLSLLELTRVIELYNTRNGASRTGRYKVVASVTEDGFEPDLITSSAALITLAEYHSGDSDRDGKLSLLELTRIIELYNYRSGLSRTGQYHFQNGTEDGFAPGP